MMERKDIFECVINTGSRDVKKSELRDGDIVLYYRKDGGAHINIYAGGKVKQASNGDFYPRTDSAGSKIRISGKKVIKVYRVKA